jgi:DtxR family Mn-dependent transcriptional regulator
MVERISEKLGHPDRCPHGWPVDPDFEQSENRELSALAELEAGTRATIVRLAEHDGELLHWFYDQGLTPGTEIEVRAAQPSSGEFSVQINGAEHAIGEKAAAGLFVRPAA